MKSGSTSQDPIERKSITTKVRSPKVAKAIKENKTEHVTIEVPDDRKILPSKLTPDRATVNKQ